MIRSILAFLFMLASIVVMGGTNKPAIGFGLMAIALVLTGWVMSSAAGHPTKYLDNVCKGVK